MSKATSEDLGVLHGATTKILTEVLTNGVKVMDKEGEVVSLTPSAAYIMASATFLKNNNITADPATNKNLEDLRSALDRKRKEGKATLTRRSIDEVADMIAKDLPGYEQ